MFSELIYTRCRQGIDILKSGRPITSDGFKVYSCTQSLLEDNRTDLPFLMNAAQGKQPYSDPAFMDEAYLYLVPDKGDSFMVDFHPVPYDANATGDYSHRAGNFLNQVLVGDFSSFYPFELFRDDAVWNAKTRGEAYYYENVPNTLPVRNDVDDPAGQISIENLAAFISDGRKEALMASVAFLIAQYATPPENRKFLVIRDDSSENIELWIAAIECAFSPRMAASLPFATRLDKFVAGNRYTVNQSGAYQTQINLQDPNQKQRYRAMIVGVDERDRTNAAAARPLANSPFVLLDGKEKRATFEADASHRYYRFITKFDDDHQRFCREFLQMLDINVLSSDIYRLYEIYTVLENAASLPNADSTAKILSFLGKYDVHNCSLLTNLYESITAELRRFLQENHRSALEIMEWLLTVSQVVGDHHAVQKLTDILCTMFADQVFSQSDTKGGMAFWESVKNSEFASGVAGYLVTPSTIERYGSGMQQFTAAKGIAFVCVYLECVVLLGTVSMRDVLNVVNYGLKFCAKENDMRSAHMMLKPLSSQSGRISDMLLSIAKGANREYAEFIVRLIIDADDSIVASDASMTAFINKLNAEGMGHLVVFILKRRIQAISRPADIEQFIRLIKKVRSLSVNDLAEIFVVFDSKLSVVDKGSVCVALTVQNEKPREAICVNSAHICAIEALTDRRKRAQITSIYNELISQGFPSESNPDYIRSLTEKILKAQMDQKEMGYMIRLFARAPAYIAELVSAILCITTPKRCDEWGDLIAVAATTRDKAIFVAITNECAKLKQGEKALLQLNDMLVSKEGRDYFRHVAEKSKELIRLQKPQSGFGKLFGRK